MHRPIVDFGEDELGDPFAWLSCGHCQHVRHAPPFINRPWVMSAEGRREKLGAVLDCVRCDRFELPEDAVCYLSTPIFDEQSVPAGLTRNHTTKAGVWGRIVLLHGQLDYHVPAMTRTFPLSPDSPGIVPPEVSHRVQVTGPVRFQVEFWRRPPGEASS